MARPKVKLNEDPYYGPLINDYISKIIKSGFLLDEDMECILDEFTSIDPPPSQRHEIPKKLLLSFSSLLLSGLLAKNYSPWVLVPSLVATTVATGYEVSRYITKTKQPQLIDKLIEAVQKKLELHSQILKFMKLRNQMMKNQTFTDMLPGRKLRDFVDTFHENQGTYIKALLKHIQTISFFCDEISEDYAQIEDLDLSKQTADNDLQYYFYVNNLQILLHSKVLSYVGVTLGSKYTRLSKDTVDVFLNKRIPRIIELILQNYNETKKAFDRLKRSAIYYAEYKERPRSENKYLHSKLKSALTDAVNNISILLDKSQIILDRLGDGAINALEDSMKDLRAHSLATHESIDLLCRLHGIVANAQPASDAEPPKHLTVNKTYEERVCGNIRYDDIVQPEEGRYMIYVGKDPEEEISRTARNDVDETVGPFCRLTLEELRRSLMQNGTFMEARKRRFSNESSEEFNADSPELSPRFDSETADVHEEPKTKSSSVNSEDVYSGKPPVPLPRSAMKTTRYLDQFFMKDMPPPPPMPTFNLGRGYEEHGGYGNKSMLEEIMTLSKQRDVKEEVFVVSDIDSD